jgi:hypothetical protein
MTAVSRRSIFAGWLVASLLVTGGAVAAPTSADRETARGLMQSGRELRDKGDLQGALQRFKGADDLMHVPTTGLEVARTQVALGLLVEARDTIAAIRMTPAKPSDPAPFKDARAKADELDATLDGRIPALTITLHGAPAGEPQTIVVDGTPLPAGVVGLPRKVDPGHHVVVAKTPHAEGKLEIDVREGEQKPVVLNLVATQVAPPVVATSPEPAADTPPGTRSHSPTALTWVGLGVGAAGVITGAIGGVLSLSKKSVLAGECTRDICGPSAYGDYNAANTFAMVSTIGFIAAGVGAGVAVVSLLAGHRDSSEPAADPPASTGLVVRPWLGVGAGGVSGSF